jgi:solute carrier family 12 (sodium/potassium/chloride transporter), member 2
VRLPGFLTPGASSGSDGSSSEKPVLPGRVGGLGTFGGVFTPSILTILGVILYLRLGWVVGSVGLGGTLVIVTLASGITFLTALSVAEIATDRVVRAGGAYYMISRSLGIEAGGAVGLPLYFAQAVSVALYTLGFAESLIRAFPSLAEIGERPVALVTTVAVALLAMKSADIAVKAQYVIMGAIVLSLVSLLAGGAVDPEPIGLTGAPAAGSAGFWEVFAVFFPAVTGIMAGVNMSGDLASPARAIPRGTLAAVGVGYLAYFSVPFVLAFRAGADTLVADPLVMTRMAAWRELILVGIWGATLSSAVGSILGAPRVLQALARDGVLPRWLRFLGTGSGPKDEPRIGTAITLGVALLAVAGGSLDVVAPVLTMFFLTTYLVLNLVAGLERFLGSPSFRPSFRVHWGLSLLGAAGCLAVMFLINAVATVAAALCIAGIYAWLERRELQAAWGDVRNGIWMEMVRAGLMHTETKASVKSWRPHLLVLSGAPTRRWSLVEIGSAFTHNRGLLTVATVLPKGSRDAGQRSSMEETIRDYLDRRGIQGMARVITAEDPYAGARALVDSYGLGPLVPNTVLLGASEKLEQRDEYCAMVAEIHHARRNTVILAETTERGFGEYKRIDVWWGGLQENGGLMLTLAYLLRTSSAWRQAEVCLKLVVPDESAADSARENLERMVRSLRVGASSEVMVSDGPFSVTLRESSGDADLIFLGIARPGAGFRRSYETVQAWTADLPTTVMVLAGEGLEFSQLLLSGSGAE